MVLPHRPQSLTSRRWQSGREAGVSVCTCPCNCAVHSLYVHGGSCWESRFSLPAWGRFVHFNEAQNGRFFFLSPILASDSNPPVSFP